MASILVTSEGNTLVVHEDINEFMSDAQVFNVVNGGWTGIYENGCYSYYDSTDTEQYVQVHVKHRNVHMTDNNYDDVLLEMQARELC